MGATEVRALPGRPVQLVHKASLGLRGRPGRKALPVRPDRPAQRDPKVRPDRKDQRDPKACAAKLDRPAPLARPEPTEPGAKQVLPICGRLM